ncbi:M4 family metallopeptidase [Clostridium sp. Marseille-Q2269]|uniref:M4 family metallopeptidase n=1 Tax=Clostridium sp. Marseille-Q2269 TaxID=2942205 RepID=UPI002072EE7C|nr:M4 family metallopeptidase [Clostridium sp. Marseille-Q2269]
MKSKKLLATVLSAVITFSAVSAVSAAPVGKESKNEPKTTTIFWEKSKQNTRKPTTDVTQKKFRSSEEINKFFKENISKFGLKKGDLKNTKSVKDAKGKTHYHTIYQVEGIPVYYGRIVFTTDQDATMNSINGRIDTAFENENWKNKINISKDDAIAKAKNNIKDEEISKSEGKLYLYNFEGTPYVVYLVDLVTDSGNWKVFVNAENGSIVNKFNNTPTLIDDNDQKLPNAKEVKAEAEKANKTNNIIDVQGQSVKGKGKTSLDGIVDIDLTYKDGKYYLKDSNKNVFTYDINNSWLPLYNVSKSYILQYSNLVENNNNNFIDDKHVSAVDAHVNLGKTYDYYKSKLNRNSIDNKGMNVEGFVHVGQSYNNAFWRDDLGSMFFGDGDGKLFSPLSKSLDVVGHEVSHGVTSKESALIYEDESGALNEAFSDIMGVAIDGKNFEIGEECFTPKVAGDTMRDMKDPSRGDQPAHMKDFVYTNEDHGGVHTNSGIINHAAYLIADGLEKAGAKDSKDIMGKIFYDANCYQWDETTNFAKCRNDVVKVTKNLYGENNNYVKIVENAFDKVGISATPQLPL